jgi:hypothetical protein
MLQGLGHVSRVKAGLVIVCSVPRLAGHSSWERLHFHIFKWDRTIRNRTLDMMQVRVSFLDLPFAIPVFVMPWFTPRLILELHAFISINYSVVT